MASESAHRRRILLAASGVILLFSFADVAALGRFSPLAFGTRVLWATLTAVGAFAIERTEGRAQRAWMYLIGVITSAFFAVLVELTGASTSPLFHWMLAMPLLVAVVVQDAPGVTLASAAAMILCGIGVLISSAAAGAYTVEWVVQASGMSALAWYASATYARLRVQKLAAQDKAKEADSAMAAKARAEAQVRSRDDFLSVASHELRTPLTSLTLLIQSLRNAELSPARLESIERQLRRLTMLLQDLFDLSRLRHSGLELKLEDVDLTAVAAEVVSRVEPIAAQAGCELSIDAPSPVVGRWDRMRLEQVLTNLLSNATKYGAGKPVHVTVKREGELAVLSVQDAGIGIAPEDQKRIFDRFERAVSASNYGGLGLGLWIVREVVSALGGEVTVTSSPGRGSIFEVRLRTTPPPPPAVLH